MNLAIQGDFCARVYCHADMLEFTDVKVTTYRNWLRDGSISAGTRTTSDRLMYSVSDLLKIKLINDLAISGNVPVTKAAEAAELARQWFEDSHAELYKTDACLVVRSDDSPRLTASPKELEVVLTSKPATVIRLSEFMQSALAQHGLAA